VIPADKRTIRQWLREYAEEAIDSPNGAHPVALVSRLLDEHPEVRGHADELLEDALRGWANEAIKPKRMETAPLPGLGDSCPITVTAPDGEGGYIVKSIRLATVADLVADVAIHEENVTHALRGRRLALRRNDRLVPLMEEHGFELAGDALDLLEQQGEP